MRLVGKLCLVLFLAMAGNSYGSLLGYWSMNESSGTTASDGSGNGNNAVLQNSAAFVSGYSGNALSTNTSTPNYATVTKNSSLVPTTGQLTIDAWVNCSVANDSWQTIASKWGNYYVRVAPQWQGGIINFAVFDTAGNEKTYCSVSSINLNEWTHITATYDGTTAKIYSNGVEKASYEVGVTMNTANANDLYIGSGNWGTADVGEGFNGLIDEVRIYDQVVPEPMTLILLSLGGLFISKKSRKISPI